MHGLKLPVLVLSTTKMHTTSTRPLQWSHHHPHPFSQNYTELSGPLGEAIDETWGSFDAFKTAFNTATIGIQVRDMIVVRLIKSFQVLSASPESLTHQLNC